MQFHHILYALSLLTGNQKECLYRLAKKIVYLSLAVLFTNCVSATEAVGIKSIPSSPYPPGASDSCLVEPTTKADCAGYMSFATAQAPRTFDYDPGLLPELAEVIFALRVKHANIGQPFVLNLSGNYLLLFTKDGINILDTYTKNSDVYEYQSANPNITIGLGVSKGLPRNYKSIIIKEDAHGQLYDYAALHSVNITTNETILSETLSHPFYEIAGQGGVEDDVTTSKAMTFYHTMPSHSRHARCVKSSSTVLEQFMEIFRLGSAVCGPEAAPDIRSANHKTAAQMKLDQPLVEATVNTGKYPERLGYRLQERLDLNGKDPVALLAAAEFCQESVMKIIGKHRKKRALDLDDCPEWVGIMVSLYRSLDLNPIDIYEIVEAVKLSRIIPAIYFPHGIYPQNTEGRRLALEELIVGHINDAAEAIQIGAAAAGQAAGASASAFDECGSQASGASAAAGGRVDVFKLNEQAFVREPNKVNIIKRESHMTFTTVVKEGEQYSVDVIYLGNHGQRNGIYNVIKSYITVLGDWIEKVKKKRNRCSPSSKKREIKLNGDLSILLDIDIALHKAILESSRDLVISTIHYNDNLIGISIGRIRERTYYPERAIESPETLFADDGANIGQLVYLRSAVLEFLFLNGMIDRSELAEITGFNTGHDEL